MVVLDMVCTEAFGPVLITGAGGALGHYFRLAWAADGLAGRQVVPLVRPGSKVDASHQCSGDHIAPFEAVDLADAAQTDALIARWQPSVVIHCAAQANVDTCEEDRTAAFRDNVAATRSLVDALARHVPSCHLIHVSTDQVYRDGGGQRGDVGPVNLYGWTKLWSEDIARQHAITTVLRLNYVGKGTPSRPGLVSWLVNSLEAGKSITLFQDVLFNPCHGSLVPVLARKFVASGLCGVFNVGSSGGGLSKADFLLQLAQCLHLPTETAHLGHLSDVGLKAPRPLDMRMDVSGTAVALGVPLPSIASTLDELVAEWQGVEREWKTSDVC